MTKKLLTVFGATGKQGGALIKYVLKNPELSGLFELRGITRNKSKPAAVSLAGQGVEMIEADMDDPISLIKALAGSYAVFAMTQFWEKMSAENEVAQGKAMADAAVAAGATLLIWSSLPNVTKMTDGKMTGVKHFDSKANVEEYIRTLPIKAMFFMPGWFMQNHLEFGKPVLSDDGTYKISQPLWGLGARIPLIDIDDTGKFAAPALLNPEKYDGTNFTAATAFYTPVDMFAGWKKVTGKTVGYYSAAELAGRNPQMGMLPEQIEAIKDAEGLLTEYAYYGSTGSKDLGWTLEQLLDAPTTWEEFVQRHEPWF